MDLKKVLVIEIEVVHSKDHYGSAGFLRKRAEKMAARFYTLVMWYVRINDKTSSITKKG